jgi:Tol biopolymer transport system component
VIADCNYECHHRDAAWSPDGTHLLFTREFDQSPSQLVIVDADGRKPVVLRTGEVSAPTWSPDGRRVAFISSSWPKGADDWVSDVFVVDRDGSGLTQITGTPDDEGDLDWSASGLLAFRRTSDPSTDETYEIWTMLPDGSQLRRLTGEGQPGAAPDWAPGGDALTFVRDGAVWTMSAAGTEATQLATGHSPVWAPDGSVIAYISADDGAIHTISPTGTGDVRIGSPITRGSISALDWQPLPME